MTTRPDGELDHPPQLAAALWAMKYARTQIELALKALGRLAGTVDRVMQNDPAFKEIELYLLSSSGLTPEELFTAINQFLTDTWLKEDIMSTAEMLIARGKAQGISQGISQGKAEGEQAEKLAIASRLRKLGVPLSQICIATGLSEKEAAEL